MALRNSTISISSYCSGKTKTISVTEANKFPTSDRMVKIILHSREEALEAEEKGFIIFREEINTANSSRINFFIQRPFSEIIGR